MNVGRSQAKLVVHGEYLYVFGGYDNSNDQLDTAERMKIGEDEWNMLPCMKELRRDSGVYVSGNRIYLIGGRGNTSIEYYDVDLNEFFLVENVEVPEGGAICGLVDDKLYVLAPGELRVFSNDLKQLLSRYKIKNPGPYCYSNVIVKGSNLIFINSQQNLVYSLDTQSKKLNRIHGF